MGDQTVALRSHPGNIDSNVVAITVGVAYDTHAGLSLRYRLIGRLDALSIPLVPACASCPRKPVDGLWQHTCFELFVAGSNTPAYREYNFSPAGDWACYAFSDYRQRDPAVPLIGAPQLSLDQSDSSLQLDVILGPRLLDTAARTLRLGLSAVIKATDGSRTYWALSHPTDKPDFHRSDSFTIDLAIPPTPPPQ